jgi:segregation and condensation protein B
MSHERTSIKHIIEAALLAADHPLTLKQLIDLFQDELSIGEAEIQGALRDLSHDYTDRAIELKEVATGYRIQARQDVAPWLMKLWEEKPPKYSRAFLETLVLIAYRQPVTRAEIEEVRGVSVNSYIIKSLLERDWIRVVGHRDVPGKPALLATTKVFLDYFNLKNLEDLPTLAAVRENSPTSETEKLIEQLELDMEHINKEEQRDVEWSVIEDVLS